MGFRCGWERARAEAISEYRCARPLFGKLKEMQSAYERKINKISTSTFTVNTWQIPASSFSIRHVFQLNFLHKTRIRHPLSLGRNFSFVIPGDEERVSCPTNSARLHVTRGYERCWHFFFHPISLFQVRQTKHPSEQLCPRKKNFC